MANKIVNILGIRGIPAAHGGFETFAGRLAPYLRDNGWQVNVYCQIEPDKDGVLADDFEDDWEGIHRIQIGSRASGSKGSIEFDWKCIRDVISRPGIDLVLGYNTAVFTLVQRFKRRKVLMNMDGIEWRRPKWSLPIRAWFYLNEAIGATFATVPIADHPEIAKHLHRHGCFRSVVIPYGGDRVEAAEENGLQAIGVTPGDYLVSIARIEPENSILEVVRSFSRQKRRVKLVVLGNLRDDNAYHRSVREAASDDVIFPGAIYDQKVVSALRFFALAYVHGHQVGGTNPSLVEALGAGNAVIAHDNRFNRWVAGEGQFYFSSPEQFERIVEEVEARPQRLTEARNMALDRHRKMFEWSQVLARYEELLAAHV